MKPGMIDVNRWNAKASMAFERICSKTKLPCFAIGVAFLDITENGEEWKYGLYPVFDPHDPPSQEEWEKMKLAFEIMMGFVKKIYSGEIDLATVDEFTKEVKWDS